MNGATVVAASVPAFIVPPAIPDVIRTDRLTTIPDFLRR